MTNRQNARLGMFRLILEFCFGHLDIIKKVPAFFNACNAFKAKVEEIDTLQPRAVKKTTGPAAGKKLQRKQLEKEALTITKLIKGFAAVTKNADLKKSMHYTKSELQNMSHEDLLPVCKHILKQGTALLPEMADFQLTESMLKQFENSIAAFYDSLPQPRLEINDKKGAGEQAELLYAEADSMLADVMDPIAVAFAETDPEFYSDYLNNRTIIDPPVRHTQAAGMVTDKVSGLPIKGALVAKEETDLSTTTSAEGDFALRITTSGENTLVCIAEGYKPGNAVIKIKRGQTTPVSFALEPIA